MSNTLISVRHLSHYYNQLCAVNDINFELKRGQILGFLGPNGAGKSTTMQILAGTLAPTEGEITIAGYDLLNFPLKAKAALGYLPEQPPLYRDMLVEEFLIFCARLHQLPRLQLKKAVYRVMEQCGLSKVKNRLIRNLSKGYQQRIGIAQAIVHNPSVVILDEPTIGLDPIQIQEIRNLIQELGQDHGVILSTHILSEVQTVCNHVQIIHHGQLILNDTIEGLLTRLQTTRLKIGLRRPPQLEQLQQLSFIERVQQLDNNYFLIEHSAELNPTEYLVEQSVVQNWGLFELTPERQSLEQIFVELTTDSIEMQEQVIEEVE